MARWKIIEDKFRSMSRGISFSEAVTLLGHYGYRQDNKGKTCGSRVRFVCDGNCDILLHKPHPQKELKEYVVKDLHNIFEQEGFWNE